jgi:hypothetical protein
MTHIHDAFELAFAILSVFPCLLIIIVYSCLRKELKSTNYYKLELIISILINIILNFVKNYGFEHENKPNENLQCIDDFYKYFAVSKSYFEMVNLFFLTSFMILLNYLLVKDDNKKNKNNTVLIILSLINWVLPMYIIFMYIGLNDKHFSAYEDIDNSNNIFYSITGQCVYFSKIKNEIHLFLIPFLFLVDVIIYILLNRILISKKKEDKDNAKTYKVNIRRITINFISHLFFFGVQYADIFFLDCFIKGDDCDFYYEYYNIVNNASFAIISYTCIFERRIMRFLNEKFTCCLPEKEPSEESEEEEDEDSDEYDEDDESQKIYDDRTTVQSNNQ